MRKFSNIDNEFMMKHGLTLPETYVLEWMLNLPIWADRIIVNKMNYYFASKNKAVEDLPMVTTKPDTMYRHYKKLESKQLINNFKINGKDYIQILPKSAEWNSVLKAESNPNGSGNKSENKSESNPTNSNIKNNSIIKDNTLFSDDQIEPISKQVIRYLNDKKDSKKPFEFTATNLGYVEARLKEGFKLEDFKIVIDFKIDEWKNNDKMKKYIRPETLFGSKFNGYLVASESHKPSNDGSNNFEYKPQRKAEML